jgi:hypothetical protein
VRGDFDHDEKPDLAEVVPNGQGAWRLVIRRGAAGHPTPTITELSADELANFVTKAKPGRWRTWCGKGGDMEDDQPCEPVVRLRGDTLDFGTEEASEAVAICTGKQFRIVWLSD